MIEEKPINGKAIYTPKGAALEYGRTGANFYTGCPHECEYCYLKRGITGKALGGTEVRLKKCFKDEADAANTLRKELDKHLEQCQRYGIFLSFTTDPMIDETRRLTDIAIIEATLRDIPVWVLTKCSTFIYDEEFMATLECINPAVRKFIHFGFTLTGRDDMEPKANTNADRIIGHVGVVQEAIDNREAVGLVKVDGTLWTARSLTDQPIPAGAEVVIRSIEGVKVMVEPVQ